MRKALSQELTKIPGAHLVDVSLVRRDGETTAWAVARRPQPISPELVARLNDIANNVAGRDVDLIVRSVITAETTRYGNVYEPDLLPDEDLNRK